MLFPTWGQIAHAFLTLSLLTPEGVRSTCMPNPCRQRSFWARIKLSVQKLFCSRQVCLCFFTFSKSWIHVWFKFSLSKLNSVCFTVWIWLGPFALFNFSRNTGFFNPLYFIHSASFQSGATSSQYITAFRIFKRDLKDFFVFLSFRILRFRIHLFQSWA